MPSAPPTVTTRPSPAVLLRSVSRLREPSIRGASIMAVLTLVASAVNYLSNLVFSRVLSPASFGDLTALLALSVVVAIPTAAAQTVIAERVATYSAAGRPDIVRYLVRHALAHVLTIAVAVGALYSLTIPLVVELLNLQAVGPALALAPLIVMSFLLPAFLAVLQGLKRFVAYGLVFLAVAVARIAFGVPTALAGGGAGGALAGQALGIGVVLLVGAVLLRQHASPRGRGAATSGARRKPDTRAVAASASFVFFALVSNLDLLLAKLFLAPAEAGVYAALATLGKIVIFLPGAIAVVMVPSAASIHSDLAARARLLRRSALLVLVTTLLVSVPCAVAPGFVVETMFGPEYAAAASGVVPMVIAGTGLSVLNLLVVYSVAIQDRRWIVVLVLGVLVQVAGISAFHASPAQVATVQAVAVFAVLATNELAFHSLVRARRVARAA